MKERKVIWQSWKQNPKWKPDRAYDDPIVRRLTLQDDETGLLVSIVASPDPEEPDPYAVILKEDGTFIYSSLQQIRVVK